MTPHHHPSQFVDKESRKQNWRASHRHIRETHARAIVSMCSEVQGLFCRNRLRLHLSASASSVSRKTIRDVSSSFAGTTTVICAHIFRLLSLFRGPPLRFQPLRLVHSQPEKPFGLPNVLCSTVYNHTAFSSLNGFSGYTNATVLHSPLYDVTGTEARLLLTIWNDDVVLVLLVHAAYTFVNRTHIRFKFFKYFLLV